MQLSKRLGAVAALVTAGGTVADVGTDHAYLPIWLIRTGAASRAIAMDVNPGPLARAQEHIAQYGMEAAIETRRSDGLAALRQGEADSIVIAGMGGALMARILETGLGNLRSCRERVQPTQNRESARGSNRLESCRELILQPQSEIWLVRAWLDRNGWEIAREDMVCEDGKFYPMMRAERADAAALGMDEMDLRFGPLLLRERHPVLREFLIHERELNRRILASLEGQSGETARTRAEEVQRAQSLVEAALAKYEVRK